MCWIPTFWDTMYLSPKCFTSAVDDGATSVLVTQFHTGLTLSIAVNLCEDILPRFRRVVIFPVKHSSPRWQAYIFPLQTSVKIASPNHSTSVALEDDLGAKRRLSTWQLLVLRTEGHSDFPHPAYGVNVQPSGACSVGVGRRGRVTWHGGDLQRTRRNNWCPEFVPGSEGEMRYIVALVWRRGSLSTVEQHTDDACSIDGNFVERSKISVIFDSPSQPGVRGGCSSNR